MEPPDRAELVHRQHRTRSLIHQHATKGSIKLDFPNPGVPTIPTARLTPQGAQRLQQRAGLRL